MYLYKLTCIFDPFFIFINKILNKIRTFGLKLTKMRRSLIIDLLLSVNFNHEVDDVDL